MLGTSQENLMFSVSYPSLAEIAAHSVRARRLRGTVTARLFRGIVRWIAVAAR
jgi:hypothetical protein